ncbi:hypothetical protein B0H16DRAFT_1736506 [Mycena metata]|uniref:Uncharacterized protein n=1 Tax=Mycena metata TaxID=1033252 RepID=A0AAD7MN58_9AGAR|nr:hypothetical protein B0H16DRAFT_1736506 [Mycena metata]
MEYPSNLAKKAGARLTGTLEPGVRLQEVPESSAMDGVVEPGRQEAEAQAQALAQQVEAAGASDEEGEELDDEGGVEEDDAQVAEQLHTIYMASEDVPPTAET